MAEALEPFEMLVKAQHEDMLKALQQIASDESYDLDPALTPFGVRVKSTRHGWVVLTRQLFNWRINDCRNDPLQGVPTEFSGIIRAWCYGGTNSMLTSLLAAVAWSGQPDTEPSGWMKSVMDERRDSEPVEGIRQE